MIPERFMVTGKTNDGGTVVGWYLEAEPTPFTKNKRTEIVDKGSGLGYFIVPDNVEPVAVKIAPLPGHSNANCDFQHGRERGLCPNCGKGIGMWDYCPLCGQRLDWRQDNE